MATFTTTLTDAETKAMEYIAVSVQDWTDNALKNRARISIDEIYDMEVARMTADPLITTIPADKEQVVLDAVIDSAAVRQAAAEADTTTV